MCHIFAAPSVLKCGVWAKGRGVAFLNQEKFGAQANGNLVAWRNSIRPEHTRIRPEHTRLSPRNKNWYALPHMRAYRETGPCGDPTVC
jgi:hypothetical protein